MIPLSPPLLIATAGAFVGAGAESETSSGRLLDIMLRRVGQLTNGPWSAAFVHHVGYWSHFDLLASYSTWPLPATNDPRELVSFGEERNISAREPERGDVFVHWSTALRQHVRAGIIVAVEEQRVQQTNGRTYWVCVTIEGETTEYGAPTGTGIYALRRQLSFDHRDRFLRWTSLDVSGLVADPTAGLSIEGGRPSVRRAA